MRVAVIGHVEWCEFVRVERVPLAGEIADGSAYSEEPAGGGAMAAVQMARLGGRCDFFTALGDDPAARRSIDRLGALGVTVHAAKRFEPTRRAWVYTDSQGERTITVIGKKLVPALDDPLSWDVLDAADAVFFVAGRRRRARAGARSASPGRHHTLAAARPGRRPRRRDRVEQRRLGGVRAGRPAAAARRVGVDERRGRRTVAGRGRAGGHVQAAALPGAVADAYGAGTPSPRPRRSRWAAGDSIEDALALGAQCGAEQLTRSGPYA